MTGKLILPESGVMAATPNDVANPDVYQRLLRERIVFLGTQVDHNSANLICAQLLLL
jgi:ATP-dependent Clp protease protease subunit